MRAKIAEHWVDEDAHQIIITGHHDYDSVIEGGGIRFEIEDEVLVSTFDLRDVMELDEIIRHLINLRSEIFGHPRVQDESIDAHLEVINVGAKLLWEDSTDPEVTEELHHIGESVQLARIALARERESRK